MSVNKTPRFQFRVVWLIGLAWVVLLLSFSAYIIHESKIRQREHVERELQVINQLQRQNVQAWYDQRLTDAAALIDNDSLGENAAALFQSGSGHDQAGVLLQRSLRSLLEHHNYTGVWLLDTTGDVQFSLSSFGQAQAPSLERSLLSRAFRQAEAIIVPPRHDPAFEHPFLSVLVPVYHEDQAVAAIWLVMDVRLSLYPILERWPVRSTTAGSALILRDQDRVVYLSPVNHPDDGSESLSSSITETSSPAAQAVTGMRGLYTGFARDGTAMIAVASSLRGVPWVLLSTVQLEEAMVGEWHHLLQLIAPIMLTLLVTGLVLFYMQHAAWRRERALKQALQEQVRTDGLTTVSNRLALNERLSYEWQRAVRQNIPLSILMVDIDHFKQYNDFYGHLHGDDILRRVAALISSNITRSVDMVARYGGEEFVVVLPDTTGSQALKVAEHVCQAVRQAGIEHGHPLVRGVLTVSIGVASCTPALRQIQNDASGVTTLLQQADIALYQAKERERDQVVMYDAAFMASD